MQCQTAVVSTMAPVAIFAVIATVVALAVYRPALIEPIAKNVDVYRVKFIYAGRDR
jgi:hypothetical protein